MRQPNLQVRSKQLISVDGLDFKDLNGNGELDPYEDWRLTPAERANANEVMMVPTGIERKSLFVSGAYDISDSIRVVASPTKE